jgi:hypothetical protein
MQVDFKKYVGGKKRNNGLFTYFESNRLKVGSNHVPMTKVNRDRLMNRNNMQKGRKVA